MRVNFKHPTSSKDRKKKRLHKLRNAQAEIKESGFDVNMGENENSKLNDLSKAKRKQIFKKDKSRDIKAQIAQLRIESKKLKKKDLSQKAEKKKIAKQIKALKAQIKRSSEDAGADNDESSDSSSD